MVRETRYLLVGNLPEKTTEDAVGEHFKRYGKIQSIKLHHKENEEGSSAIVAFGDIKTASKAHCAENRIEGNLLSTAYCEGSATGSAVTRTVERPGYIRQYNRSKGSEDGESFDSYYGNNRYSGSYGEDYTRGRPRERFSGRGTFKSYDTRGGFHGRAKTVDQTSQDGFEKPKVPHSPAHSTSRSGSRHSSKHKKKHVSRSGSRSSSSSSSSGSTSSSASRSSSRSSSRCSATRSRALPSSSMVKSYRTESQESNNSDKTGAIDVDDKRPRGICINHLPLRSTDTSLRDGLFHEYKKYGKVNAVLVAGAGDERYAVVSFRKPEDAVKALTASQDKVFFGSKIKVAQHEGIEVDDNEFRPPEAELDEHHPKATRTLFVGNLEKDISNQELRERFLKYGDILDIDVKRQGAVSAYAFVQFTDIRSVVKVLREMEGEVWGSMKLKLGFGKSMPTNCVWLDNVDQTVQENFLSRQFGRYGQVTHGIIDRIKGKALVYFTNAEQAQYALLEMRNRILNNKKIMIDFASRDCQAEFYQQMEKNGQLKPGLHPDERRGWMFNRQTSEGQWEASYDNRPANFFKFTSHGGGGGGGGFRGRGSRTGGRGGSRGYKEDFSEEYRRTRSYEDYRYPGDSDDFEQDLRAYQRERQHGSQSPPPFGEDMYDDPAYRRAKEYYKYAESFRSGSPHSDRAYEGYDKIRVDEKYYGKERYIVRERSPDVEYGRSWSRSPSHGAQGPTKDNFGRNTPPTPMDDEVRDFSSRDVSPVEESQSKFSDSKNKRRSEDDFNINEADIAELSGRSKYPGVFRKDDSLWSEDKYERKRSYDETFGQDYLKSPRKLDRQFSSKSSLERIESSKREIYQKYQMIQSRITEKLKGRNESSPSSASSGSEPGQVNEGGLSKLQHEKALLLEKLKQLDKESSTSDIEEALDIEDQRKVASKRPRIEPMGPWGDSVHQSQMELGVSKSYDYRGIDSTSNVRKQPDCKFDEKERNKFSTRSSVEESDHEEFTSLVSPKDGFIKKRRKSELSEDKNRSYRSKHGEEEDRASSDNDEIKNISRLDQLSSNPGFRRLSSNHSSPRNPHFSHDSSSELQRQHSETDILGSEGINVSFSEESKLHKKTESSNKSHSHRSKHRHKEEHQPTIIPLGDDFPNSDLLDPRNPQRIHKSLSLPLPKFAELDANVMTSPDVSESPSKTESPRFSSPSSGSKNTSPQRSPSESASTNSQENPQQEYIPEENPSDMNNDAVPVESMEVKGEFDSDGSSDHSDHNYNFEIDKISLEERIRRIDEKLNAVPVPQNSTKLASDIGSSSTNTAAVSKSDTHASPFCRTALYSKFKINKKEIPSGTGTDVKSGENVDITKKVTSRFSIIDQDTKRLQDKIYENYSPKPLSHTEDTPITSSPMTPLRTKGAVKEMPAQMPNLSTLPGSLAGRLGNGAAPFPTLTVTTTTSNNGRAEEMNALDVSTVNPALMPTIPEKQWQMESSVIKPVLKPWQMDTTSMPKNSSNDQSCGKDSASGPYLSEENALRPLITPAFKKQMSDNFSRSDEKSSPRMSPKSVRKSPSPSLDNKVSSPGHDLASVSPKSDNNMMLDHGNQKSSPLSDIAQSGSETSKLETESSLQNEGENSTTHEDLKTSHDLSHISRLNFTQGNLSSKTKTEPMDVSIETKFTESKEVESMRNTEVDCVNKLKNTSSAVLTKAEVKDMSPLKMTKQTGGNKEKSAHSGKELQQKQNQESVEDILGLHSPMVLGKRKAEKDEVNNLPNEKEKNKEVVREHKCERNSSDSDSKEVEKVPKVKKQKISKTECHSSETSPEKMDKSNCSTKSKDSQKKEKNKDSKKKEKCEGDSSKKDKNNHERKDKDKDGGRDKGSSTSSSKSLSLSSSSSSKVENNKNSKTDEKIVKSTKSEEKKSEKSSKVTGSTKSLDDKQKSSESSSKSDEKTLKPNKEKTKSSEHKKDAEKDKKVNDHSVHRKDNKASTSKPSSEVKSKEKSKDNKDKVNVKSKDVSKSDKNTKDGMNDRNGSKPKKEEKLSDKSGKSSTEKSSTEKAKEVSEGKEKNPVVNENRIKSSKSMDAERKEKSSLNPECKERSKEKSPSNNAGSDAVALTDQLKDNKMKGKQVSNDKSGKSKNKDQIKSKVKEKHSASEKVKDKVSKDGKSSVKREENRTETQKDSTEKKSESKSEHVESSKSQNAGSSEKSDDKKSENTDGKTELKGLPTDSKKKVHESSKPLDKIHKSHKDKPKSSSWSVSEDIMKFESTKHLKEADKSKSSKTERKSKNDPEKVVKTESKVNKPDGDKKKKFKVSVEKKKHNKEGKSETAKKKEEKIEEHKASDVAKKADDEFDWDAWQEPYVSMYDKVKRRSTIKDKEREMEQNRQKQLDRLQERRQKKSKNHSVLQSDISSTNYSDSDDIDSNKKLFNKRKSKSKKIYSSSDSDSDYTSSIFPPEKKLQAQKPKVDPSKKSKKASFLDIYSSDSDDSTDSSFSALPVTKKKTKHLNTETSVDSDDVFHLKSKKVCKKDQQKPKPRASSKSTSGKKSSMYSIYSTSDETDDSDSDLDFSKKLKCAKKFKSKSDEKYVTQKSYKIYSSSDSESVDDANIIPAPKPISLPNKSPKHKTKEKQKNQSDDLKIKHVNESNLIEGKTVSDREAGKGSVISQTVLEKDIRVESVLDSVEKITERNKKEKLAKKNKKKEKENILVGEGKLEIGKNIQYGLFEKMETFMAQNDTINKKSPIHQKSATEDGFRNKMKDKQSPSTQDQVKKQKDSKKKKIENRKEREAIKNQPSLISPIMSPVNEFSDGINIDEIKHDDGNVIVDEIPLEENSMLMDPPCNTEDDNARGMWDSSDETFVVPQRNENLDKEKLSSLSSANDDLHMPDKALSGSEDAKSKKLKKKKVEKDSETPRKSKKVEKIDKDGSKTKKKKSKNKHCSEVDKIIDDVSKGIEIFSSNVKENGEPDSEKADGINTDLSDVDLDFSTPLFGNFVPKKVKPNRPSAKDRPEDATIEGDIFDEGRKADSETEMSKLKDANDDIQGSTEETVEKTVNTADAENKIPDKKQSSLEVSATSEVVASSADLGSPPKEMAKTPCKELNDVKLADSSCNELERLCPPNVPEAKTDNAYPKKKNSKKEPSSRSDIFDFNDDDEEEAIDKLKPRHNAERDSSLKTRKPLDSKIPFKWDIGDITSKDTKTSFESKMTNKLVNHKQESLFASWAKSLAEGHEKDHSTNESTESNSINKIHKRLTNVKNQFKFSQKQEGIDADRHSKLQTVGAASHEKLDTLVDDKNVDIKNLAVAECEKERKNDESKKPEDENSKFAETVEAVSTIQLIQDEEKKDRENDAYADEGSLVIDETNSCISETTAEQSVPQEPPQADSETALAIQSILGLEVEDNANKLQDYSETEAAEENSFSENQPEEDNTVSEVLINETHRVENKLLTGLMQENKPTTGLIQENKPPTGLIQENKPTTALIQENKPPTGLVQENKPPTGLIQENKPPTGLIQENKPPTGLIQENKPPTGLIQENKPPTGLIQEPVQEPAIPLSSNFASKSQEQVPTANLAMSLQGHVQTTPTKQKTPKGKKQKQTKPVQQLIYQHAINEDYLQDTQNIDDSDDGALHIATDLPTVPPKEDQVKEMHLSLEKVEQLPQTAPEFEVPHVKKSNSRRKKSGKSNNEPNLVSDIKINSVLDTPYNIPVLMGPNSKTDVDTRLDITAFGSPPVEGEKVIDDREISMSDYTDSERNDDGDLGSEESKRPQRGTSKRKNYKKMSGILPRTNSPRSRTSPRSPRVASPKQLSPKSDIATPVVKIERLTIATRNPKLDEDQTPKDIQPSVTPVKETVPVKDSCVRRGRSAGSAVEPTQKTLNVYDFDEVEIEEHDAQMPKRRSSTRKKKNNVNEEAFESKDTGKVLKSEIMDTSNGIKMTIRPTVRPSKDLSKEKETEIQKVNESKIAVPPELNPTENAPYYPVAMKPRHIMSADHRARAHSFAKEGPKAFLEGEHPPTVAPQTSPPMSNVDRIIDNVSKGIFDSAGNEELIAPQQVDKFSTPLTIDTGTYERKRTASRSSYPEDSILKSPSMKSPALRSPQLSAAASPAFQLAAGHVKTPPNTVSAVNPLHQSKMNALLPNTLYAGHMSDLQNKDMISHHLMPSTPTATSSPISTQSTVIGTMANKPDVHVTMTVPQLTNNIGRVPAHMSSSLGKAVTTPKEIGMNLTKSAFESTPTTVLSTVSSTSVGRSVIASAHSHLAQTSNAHLTTVGMKTQNTQPNPSVNPSMSVASGQRMQHISSHLQGQPAPGAEKSGMSATVSVGERHQIVTSAPTCVVHPITTTSLSKQPHNMPTMIQPPTGGERFYSDHTARESITKEQLQHLPYLQLMQEMQQHPGQKSNKTCQKQPDISKESPQRPPSAHSNQQKQVLPGDHVRIAHEQAYLAMQDKIRTQFLHSKSGFYPTIWTHPHLIPTGVKVDDKKQEIKTTSPNLHQQHNIVAASSQHPQIKSPALAQTAPSIHPMGHQLATNSSPPNGGCKKISDKANVTRLGVSAHEGSKSRPPSHETSRASPREHWSQPSNMHTPVGPKPAHQLPDHNPPMSQKEHIKKKRAEERKQQELEEMHYKRQMELQFLEKQLQMEQAAGLHKPGSSTSNQPTDMRQTAHVHGQQRPDGQVDGKNMIDPRFVQHPMYQSMPDIRRPSSQNPSAFTPPISGSDISPAIPAHKNYAEIQQQLYNQQHAHLYNVPMDPHMHLIATGLPPHYLPRPGLSIQDLTESVQPGRSRSPLNVQNNPVSSQTSSKHRDQEDRMAHVHEAPLPMQPRVIQESPAPGGEGSLLSLLQRYPVMWQGVLALKNDQCVVQLHMINGYEQLVKLSLPQQGPDGSVQPLRIAQRMRLEAAQLDGVIKRMKFDNDYCMLLALPCGRDHDHIIEQTRAMTTGFIQYLQQKQAAGIVNVAEPETQQPAYVVHIFPPCDFSRSTLERLGFDLMQPLRDLAHLLVIITTVA